ncbi:MAG: hypothetical protein JOZ04_15355 [Acidimicrobiia bacterium]|nr:hypothetical protein [Acidimicrobiia bacterium]
MRPRFRIAAALGTAALVTSSLGLLAPAAHAATTGNTATTFTLSGGALSISVPATANLTPSAVATGTPTLSGALGSTNVTDARGNLTATWTVTVTSTNFTTGGASANETVPKANVSYSSGAATATTGTGAFTPGTVASLNGTLPATQIGGTWAGVSNNSATWNPTIGVTLLNSNNTTAVAGTYTGTITQSVA